VNLHPDLHRYLDGEIPLEALPEELRHEARRWAKLGPVLAALRSVQAPETLAPRVMARIRGTRPSRGLLDALWAPRPVRPIAIAAAAAVAFLLAFPVARLMQERASTTTTAATETAQEPVLVQFVFSAPGARSVAVAGDFNGWEPDAFLLRDDDGDGVWTGLFPVPRGIHKYMFIVDGDRWVTDPYATAYVDDGFGGKNALLEILHLNGRQS